MERRNLIGETFGRWIVIDSAVSKNSKNAWMCECQCEKKTIKVQETYTLTSGASKSCGCNLSKPSKRLWDFTGKKVDKLLIIERVFVSIDGRRNRTRWKTICDCGNEEIINSDYLISSSKNRMCSICRQKDPDITGQIINNWKILEFVGIDTKYKKGTNSIWKCLCLGCNKNTVNLHRAKIKKTILCKDCNKEVSIKRRFDIKKVCVNNIHCAYRSRARRENKEFQLLVVDVESIIFRKCEYCGSEPASEFKHTYTNGDTTSIFKNGIDRIDSSIGYLPSNVVTCCWECNNMKSDYSKDFFIEHCKLIVEHNKS